MKIVWFKRDLRLHDHEALHEALSTSGKTLLLYIFEPSLMKDYHYSQRHFDFIKQSLEALQKELLKYHTQNIHTTSTCGLPLHQAITQDGNWGRRILTDVLIWLL